MQVADISKITLPDGSSYDIKDISARNVTALLYIGVDGVDTFSDIYSVYSSKAVVIYGRDNFTYQLVGLNESEDTFYFTHVDENGALNIITLNDSDQWSTLTNVTFVPTSRTINNQALTSNITLTAANVGAIATPSSATSGQVLTYNGTTWVASTPAAGGTQKVTKTITGDGSTFRFTINDANVLSLYPGIVQIYDSNWNVVNVDIQFSATGIVILFDEIDAVPAAGTTYTVVIIG